MNKEIWWKKIKPWLIGNCSIAILYLMLFIILIYVFNYYITLTLSSILFITHGIFLISVLFLNGLLPLQHLRKGKFKDKNLKVKTNDAKRIYKTLRVIMLTVLGLNIIPMLVAISFILVSI